MVATADGVQERGLSAGMSEIAATHGEAVEAVRRKNMARPDAGTEFLGVRRTRTGKYAAQIWEPLGRINVWLGTFDTAEDAAKAYTAAAAEMQAAESVIKKNTAAAELQAAELAARMKAAAELQASERAVKKKTAAELQAAEGAVKNKTAAAGPGAWTKFHGVRRQPSGKYTATIWHPSRRSQEYLGTFDTAEDAAKAYDAAAVKLPCMRKPVKKDATGRPYARTEFRGVSRTTNGKYQATITQSNGKARMWLGTFATAEEAARAYDAAAVKLHGAAAKTNFRVDDGIGVQAVRQEKTAPSVFRGVSQQQNGKYRARIRDPVQRARLCLGIFDKAEDAAHAYDAEAVRLHGERAITNFKRPFVDLKDFPELPALDFFSDTIFPGAQFDDLWTDLPEAELQPVDELLKDMEFDDVAA